MKLGMVARTDSGGLGNLTIETARALQPARILVVTMAHGGRGETRLDRVRDAVPDAEVLVCRYPQPGRGAERLAAQWAAGLDVCWTAETWYWPWLEPAMRRAGARTVLYAMPELHDWRSDCQQADVVWRPTTWAPTEAWSAVPVLAPGIALDRVRYRERGTSEPPTVFHLPAPAMADRNGTTAVLAALPLLTRPAIFAEVRPARDWWDLIPDEADAFLLPRRYAGLSLPILEAAAAGLAIITTDLPPQNSWCSGFELIPTAGHVPTHMKGGLIPVARIDPREVARAVDRLTPDRLAYACQSARAWAESFAWPRIARFWHEALAEAADPARQ